MCRKCNFRDQLREILSYRLTDSDFPVPLSPAAATTCYSQDAQGEFAATTTAKQCGECCGP